MSAANVRSVSVSTIAVALAEYSTELSTKGVAESSRSTFAPQFFKAGWFAQKVLISLRTCVVVRSVPLALVTRGMVWSMLQWVKCTPPENDHSRGASPDVSYERSSPPPASELSERMCAVPVWAASASGASAKLVT